MPKLKYYTNNDFKIIDLEPSELEELQLARSKLYAILKLEELYDQIIESFLEFKTQLYSNSLSLINDFRRDYNANHEIRSKLNRQLFNVLNLSKLYLDKHYHEGKGNFFVKDLTNNLPLHQEIVSLRKDIYDTNLNYRLGCELRNLTQHSSLPIRTYTVGTQRLPNTKENTIKGRFHLPIAKENLLKSGVKKSVLASFDDVIDLHSVMDGYIYAISQMHFKNRELTSKTINESKHKLSSKIKKIEELHCSENFGIEVYQDNKRLFYLEFDWFEVVEYLQRKHAIAINYNNTEHTTYSD